MPTGTGTLLDAKAEASKMDQLLNDAAKQARSSIGKVDDPHAHAMFETAAEVLIGLSKAFNDYGSKNEPGFR